MDGTVHWARSSEELEEALEKVGGGPLCVDTEADSFHHFREKVCLIQLSFGGSDLLVDPLEPIDFAPLGSLLSDPRVPKILHGADYDVRMLHRDFSFELHGLFDTMVAARLVGEPAFGLAALLDKYMGVSLDKRHQRADWSQRPLPAELEEYAAMDTRYLRPLADRLSRKLAGLGRLEWAEEEFRAIEALRRVEPAEGTPGYLRIKGAARLEGRQLAVLRELAGLRDAVAEQTDRPRFRVLGDPALLELARRSTDGPLDLAVRGISPSWRAGTRRRRLRDAIDRGLAVPDDELPQVPRRPRRKRDGDFEARLRELSRRRDRVARQLGIEPPVLAPRAVLEEMLRCVERDEPLEQATGLRRWQRRLLEPELPGRRG